VLPPQKGAATSRKALDAAQHHCELPTRPCAAPALPAKRGIRAEGNGLQAVCQHLTRDNALHCRSGARLGLSR